ncbi:MAG: lytic murein transglycosylase B [Gammaproteobacteria bacterium]|nr:lytic murein transglycosylase B [Gammaproteobacteria bacterium]
MQSRTTNRHLWRESINATLGLWISIALVAPLQAAEPFIERAEVQQFVRTIATKHDLNQNTIAGWFSRIESQPDILEAISTPAERTLEWFEYRAIFLTDKRISMGRAFMTENADLLQRAEETFGVPASVITAIIGVETFYGRHLGKHTALEALATLGFDFPRRSEFFSKELEEFIVLASDEGWDPLAIKGSYAAAMGMPQFISSSYRRYAIDFDNDGQRDLWNSVADVIGSVANYLSEHHWQPGAPIAAIWEHDAALNSDVDKLVSKKLKPSVTPATVRAMGFDASGSDLLSVNRLKLADSSTQTWVGYKNFYVITRYNHSRLYAMAVHQLSAALTVRE